MEKIPRWRPAWDVNPDVAEVKIKDLDSLEHQQDVLLKATIASLKMIEKTGLIKYGHAKIEDAVNALIKENTTLQEDLKAARRLFCKENQLLTKFVNGTAWPLKEIAEHMTWTGLYAEEEGNEQL